MTESVNQNLNLRSLVFDNVPIRAQKSCLASIPMSNIIRQREKRR
jgi:hypothetical protein